VTATLIFRSAPVATKPGETFPNYTCEARRRRTSHGRCSHADRVPWRRTCSVGITEDLLCRLCERQVHLVDLGEVVGEHLLDSALLLRLML
jgi:hypothetical protein